MSRAREVRPPAGGPYSWPRSRCSPRLVCRQGPPDFECGSSDVGSTPTRGASASPGPEQQERRRRRAPASRDRPRRRRGHPDEVQDHEGAAPDRGAQHDRPRAHRGRCTSSRAASSRWSGTSASRSARTSRSWCRTRVLAVQETQDGTGHAVRIALEALGRRRSRRAPCWWRTATPRCSRGRACARSPRTTSRRAAAVSILTGDGARTRSATAGWCATRRARSTGDRRAEGRDRRSRRRSARSTAASSPSTRRSSTTRCRGLTNDNAKGEYYLTDTVGARARGRPGRRRASRSTTCCRPRASTTGPSSPRSRTEMNRRILDPLDARRASRSSTRPPPGSTSTWRSRRT